MSVASRHWFGVILVKSRANAVPAEKLDAGGLRALLNRIQPLLHRDCLTVSGQSLGHESIPTTERYLGSDQNLKNAVNDALVF